MADLLDLLMEMRNEVPDHVASQTDAMKFGLMVNTYDPFMVTSALHKELRRGDFDQAVYWALVLEKLRGRFFVMRYVSNVSMEESHAPGLKTFLGELFIGYKNTTLLDVMRAVEAFCNCRYAKYMTEAEDYTWQADSTIWGGVREHAKEGRRLFEPKPELLAKWSKKLPKTARVPVRDGLYQSEEVMALLEQFIEEKDYTSALYIVHLCNVWPAVHKYTKDLLVCSDDTEEMHRVLNDKLMKEHSFWGFDYETLLMHRMDAVGDMSDWNAGPTRTDDELREVLAGVYAEVAGKQLRPIPFYAVDAHTREGKRVWLTQRKQIRPNAPCTVADLRYAANWVSMLWRREAWKQFGTIHVAWEDVVLPEDRYYKALWKGVYPHE